MPMPMHIPCSCHAYIMHVPCIHHALSCTCLHDHEEVLRLCSAECGAEQAAGGADLIRVRVRVRVMVKVRVKAEW